MNPTQRLPYLPLSKLLFPARSPLRDTLLVLGGSALVALCAQLEIPTQPVPITLQTLGVLLVGAALGSRLGLLALCTYLLEGLFLPVFSGGTTWAHPRIAFTAGYLLAFPVAAFLVGFLVERFAADRDPYKAYGAMLLGSLVIYAVGLTWLGLALGNIGKFTGLGDLFYAGMTKFLVGDLIKAAVAAIALPAVWRLLKR